MVKVEKVKLCLTHHHHLYLFNLNIEDKFEVYQFNQQNNSDEIYLETTYKFTNERVHIILISIAFYINIIFVLIHIKPLKKKCGRISRPQEIENT